MKVLGGSLVVSAAVAVALLLPAGPIATGQASQAGAEGGASASSTNPYFNSWGSCRNAKPYKPPRQNCTYDKGRWFRGTFVLKSKIGKVKVKACFRIFSRAPLGGKHGCGTSRMALNYKSFPFYVRGVRQAFKVRILWYVKKPGAAGKFGKAGYSWMTVRP